MQMQPLRIPTVWEPTDGLVVVVAGPWARIYGTIRPNQAHNRSVRPIIVLPAWAIPSSDVGILAELPTSNPNCVFQLTLGITPIDHSLSLRGQAVGANLPKGQELRIDVTYSLI